MKKRSYDETTATDLFKFFYFHDELNSDRNAGIMIDSDAFPRGLRYLIKDDQIVMVSVKNGAFSISFDGVKQLAAELTAIAEHHGGVRA